MPTPETLDTRDTENDVTVVEPLEPEIQEPELLDKQIESINAIKDFFTKYTTYILQYIELNKIYFSYNFVDFCISINADLSVDLLRKKYDIGDFEIRKSYPSINLNEICNDINKLYFADTL